MWSKNKRRPDRVEQAWLELCAELQCSVCDKPGPSELHEPEQALYMGVAALCTDCHRGPHNGIGRGIWRVKKIDERRAVAITTRRVFERLMDRLT